MAKVTTLALAPTLTPTLDVGPHWVTHKIAVVNGTAAQNDVIELLTFGKAGTIHLSHIETSATLGASATAKLVVGDGDTNVDVGGATTAGSAQKVFGSNPVAFAAGAKLYALIAGAGITAGANITARVQVQY
jgi:hypothetical protein